MNQTGIQIGNCAADTVLRDRCDALGLPLWRFDRERSMVGEPSGIGNVVRVFRTELFKRLAQQAAEAHGTAQEPSVVEIFSGAWLMVIPEFERLRIHALTVAFACNIEAFEAAPFVKACRKAGVDPKLVRDELAPFARYTEPVARQTACMLKWASDDLRTLSKKNELVAGFSQQLSDTFEEISLFYTLGQSMNEHAHPEKFVNVACEELHEALSYGWVAAAFVDDDFLVRGMAGKLTTSGALPCSSSEFEYGVQSLLQQIDPGMSSVLNPDQAGVLGSDGMQVLVRPVIHDDNVVGVLLAGGKSGKDTQVSTVDIKIFDAAAGHISVLLDNAILFEDQQLMFMGTLEALSASIDAKDPYTCGHSERVAMLSSNLARAVGMSDKESERVRIGGLVHDVGKIGVPESTLTKSGRLTDEEFEQIKLHPQIGHDILKDIPQLADVLPGVLYHHERFDGRGYPQGLSGKDIPLIARLIGLADSFDAMSSTRTYRAAMDREKVMREIIDCAGTQFDPDLAEAFHALDLSVYDELVVKHHEESLRGGLRTSRRRSAA
ncbi:MAG: HD-GYP domain-containing protein [Phycisphaerales bacterium]